MLLMRAALPCWKMWFKMKLRVARLLSWQVTTWTFCTIAAAKSIRCGLAHCHCKEVLCYGKKDSLKTQKHHRCVVNSCVSRRFGLLPIIFRIKSLTKFIRRVILFQLATTILFLRMRTLTVIVCKSMMQNCWLISSCLNSTTWIIMNIPDWMNMGTWNLIMYMT